MSWQAMVVVQLVACTKVTENNPPFKHQTVKIWSQVFKCSIVRHRRENFRAIYFLRELSVTIVPSFLAYYSVLIVSNLDLIP